MYAEEERAKEEEEGLGEVAFQEFGQEVKQPE
jgi:hypothetical protein